MGTSIRAVEVAEGLFPATAMLDRDWWAALWPEPQAVLCSLGVRPDLVVADVCCGDGHFTARLARIVGGKVYAVDIDPAMLDRTRAELASAGTTVRELIPGDARDLPELLPEPVDYVLIANTFHGVLDKAVLARAAKSVLKPGGRLAIVNWHPLPRERTVVLGEPEGPRTEMRMPPDAVRSAVAPAGFTLERVVELPPFHYGAIFRA